MHSSFSYSSTSFLKSSLPMVERLVLSSSRLSIDSLSAVRYVYRKLEHCYLIAHIIMACCSMAMPIIHGSCSGVCVHLEYVQMCAPVCVCMCVIWWLV